VALALIFRVSLLQAAAHLLTGASTPTGQQRSPVGAAGFTLSGTLHLVGELLTESPRFTKVKTGGALWPLSLPAIIQDPENIPTADLIREAFLDTGEAGLIKLHHQLFARPKKRRTITLIPISAEELRIVGLDLLLLREHTCVQGATILFGDLDRTAQSLLSTEGAERIWIIEVQDALYRTIIAHQIAGQGPLTIGATGRVKLLLEAVPEALGVTLPYERLSTALEIFSTLSTLA